MNVVATSLSNIGNWHWYSIQALLCEHCGNIIYNIRDKCWENIWIVLCEWCGNIAPSVGDQHSDNIPATLCEHCGSVAPQQLGLMLRQRSVNIVWILSQCNVLLGHFRSKMTGTFKFECSTHLQHQQASLHLSNHIYKRVSIILPTTTVELMG